LVVRSGGVVSYVDAHIIESPRGLVVMGRKAEVLVKDAKDGREKERHSLVYGAVVKKKEGAEVKAGEIIAEWDPFSQPIITEFGGTVEWRDINELTMEERADERTGFSERVIIENRDRTKDLRPAIVVERQSEPKETTDEITGEIISHPAEKSESIFYLPVGVKVVVGNGDKVDAGTVLAKRERETTKTKDITGGLPRVAELFEARKPKVPADITEIDGVVSFGEDQRGKRKLIVTPQDGEPKEYLISKTKHILVQDGERIRKGEPLTSGSPTPHDILKVKGLKELAKYLVNETQEVYRLQGVRINDKHIEVIVRQMLGKYRVENPGDTKFLEGDVVDRFDFEDENAKVKKAGKKQATFEPMLQGITKAALSTESFISAASFQETTKVLTEAAINAKVDKLRGLKENVIMGRLIPAGSGYVKDEEGEKMLSVDGKLVTSESLDANEIITSGSIMSH